MGAALGHLAGLLVGPGGSSVPDCRSGAAGSAACGRAGTTSTSVWHCFGYCDLGIVNGIGWPVLLQHGRSHPCTQLQRPCARIVSYDH